MLFVRPGDAVQNSMSETLDFCQERNPLVIWLSCENFDGHAGAGTRNTHFLVPVSIMGLRNQK
jgi:hypothetical protein